MNIIKNYLTKNTCYQLGERMNPSGLMLHSIGCPQPSAEVFARRWDDPAKEVAVHGFIDGNTGDAWQFLPWDLAGWHAGGSANKTHIGVEMGEPSSIKYKPSSAAFEIDPADVPAAVEMCERTYKAAAELFAYLCVLYNLDPMGKGVIIGHAEGHALGVASNHGDPEHIWHQLGMPYTMKTFRKLVSDILDETEEVGTVRRYYEVKKGDTLSKIARGFGRDVEDIATYNGIENADYIQVGDYIALPPIFHIVKAGDTLSKLAAKYGSTVEKLAKYNHIKDPNMIYIGQKLEV